MGGSAQFYRRSAGVLTRSNSRIGDSIPNGPRLGIRLTLLRVGDTRAPSHLSDYVITEFGAFDFGGALH